MAETRRKSRFDQEGADSKRSSRFDRSRSPSHRDSDSRRSRSPIDRSSAAPKSPVSAKEAADRAAAAAAKIKADLAAKVGSATPQNAPPVRSSATPLSNDVRSPDTQGGARSEEIYQQDGDYIKDIEVNNLKNRYTLTKGSTQKMIKEKTGADVTTRGAYYPDSSMATAANPPLYLHITSQTKEGLEQALEMIEELKSRELPNLVDERRLRRRDPEPQFERDEHGRRKWPEERIPIDLEPISGFNLRAQVVGRGGEYVKWIQSESGCRVQIKGRGSGFLEVSTNAESDEPMFLHVTGPDPNQVEHGKELAEQLLETVRESYNNFKENGGQRGGQGGRDRGGYGSGGNNYNNQGGYRGSAGSPNNFGHDASQAGGYVGSPAGGYGQGYAQGYGSHYAAAQQSADPSADPYAAYGGYDKYVEYWTHIAQNYPEQYQQYIAQGQQYQGGQAPQAHSPPPPPPPPSGGPAQTADPPPPPPGMDPYQPPPPPGASRSYGNVPPPPGL